MNPVAAATLAVVLLLLSLPLSRSRWLGARVVAIVLALAAVLLSAQNPPWFHGTAAVLSVLVTLAVAHSIRQLRVSEVWQAVKRRPGVGIQSTAAQVRAGLAERAARTLTDHDAPTIRRLGREAAAGLGLTRAHAALLVGVAAAVSLLAVLGTDLWTWAAAITATAAFGLRLIVARFNPGAYVDDTVFEAEPGFVPDANFDPTDFEEPTVHGYFTPGPQTNTESEHQNA